MVLQSSFVRGVCKGYMCTCVHVWECMCAYGVVSVSDACVGSVCVVRERRLIVKLHTAVCINL